MKYLLDANVFIQAHRFHYPFDLFPSFWEWLKKENGRQRIFSITEIYNELKKGEDELWKWMNKQDKTSWFLPVDDKETQVTFKNIANWVMNNPQWKISAKNEFLSGADPWLVAKAMTDKHTVVTQEKSSPKSERKIFIPDVCDYFQVPCLDTVKMIRILQGRF